jgi:hypothetical protein
MVVAETRMPSLASSPWILMHPHVRFSRPEAKDQPAGVWVKGRPPSDAIPSIGPLPPHQLPEPPEKGSRTHHEGCPGRAGKRSAGRCQHHAVEPANARPPRLAPEDLQLMAQDEDLDFL